MSRSPKVLARPKLPLLGMHPRMLCRLIAWIPRQICRFWIRLGSSEAGLGRWSNP